MTSFVRLPLILFSLSLISQPQLTVAQPPFPTLPGQAPERSHVPSNSSVSATPHQATPSLQTQPSDPLQSVFQEGLALERQQQWLEAIQHYEQACKQFPQAESLQRRLLIVRLHYDVVRRSNDRSIERLIAAVSTEEALDLYSEVLARLEMSYVEPLEMTEVVRGGTAYLEVALTEKCFTERYLAKQPVQRVEQFRSSIHKVTLARKVNTRVEARDIVAHAASLAQRELNLNPTATVMQFVFGAVGLLDPYSSFLSSAELNEVESQIEGNFVGLGVALQPHEAPLRIKSVIPGGPAMEAGLRAGDRIVEIDSVDCAEVGADRAADLLRGPEGSRVRLLLKRVDGSLVERFVDRRRVEVPSIEGTRLVDPAAGVGYLKISSFQKTTAEEIDEALWDLHRQGMQSLIIDLRGNPGGWLDASVAVADRFISQGGIVSTRGKNGIENQNYFAKRSGTWQVPLVVLIDGQSASASEILAGAIRDNNRGTLVGERTYGKGSVQGVFHTKSLSSGIRLTVSKFYSPSGRAISHQGVPAMVQVDSEPEIGRFVAKPAIQDDPSSQAANMANVGGSRTASSSNANAGDTERRRLTDQQQDRALRVAIEEARQMLRSAR